MKADEYLKMLTKGIHNTEMRNDIIREYRDHLEDCKEALIKEGMSETEAEEEAVRQMGDPTEAGIMMDRIYSNFIDFSMLKCMLIFAILGLFLFYLSAMAVGSVVNATNLLRYSWFFSAPDIFWCILGGIIAVYGFLLSIWEKYTGKPLFYGWYRGYFYNSGFLLVFSAAFINDTLQMYLLTILAFALLQLLIRGFMSSRQNKKETRILMEIGIADTDIFPYKGYGTINGKRQKVHATSGEIKKGSPFIVISMKGFCPIVEAL